MTPVKLSSAETKQFWEIEVLYEDNHLLALNKPPGLMVSPDRKDPKVPSLMHLLHAGIAAGKSWAVERGIGYLANAHRLDAEASGVLLLARGKKVLAELANLFGSERPVAHYTALCAGTPGQLEFEVNAPLAPHEVIPGLIRVDRKRGKRSRTLVRVIEQFQRHVVVSCQPLTFRQHQVRVHLKHAGLPVVGDSLYGGRPLLLSTLKSGYRLKPNRTERPLISQAALHAASLKLSHPVTGVQISISAPLPRDIEVALKYLRRYAALAARQPLTDQPLQD